MQGRAVIRYWPELLAGLLAAGLLWWAASTSYDWAYTNGVNAERARAEMVIGEFMAAERDATSRAREAEQVAARAFAIAADEYERGKTDAQDASERTIADLRSGNLQLRDHWQGCAATSRVSGDATAAALADAAADLRRAGAGDLVRLADQCDAQVRGLQRVAEAQ